MLVGTYTGNKGPGRKSVQYNWPEVHGRHRGDRFVQCRVHRLDSFDNVNDIDNYAQATLLLVLNYRSKTVLHASLLHRCTISICTGRLANLNDSR